MATKKFCVIGLGYFGLNLALRLAEAGAEVIAIDNRPEAVEKVSAAVTLGVCLNATDSTALKNLGLDSMDAVIVAIGEGFESSIMTTAHLQELGIKKIYNHVTSPVHERLLKLMNIDELLVPEEEAAAHLANRLMLPGLLEVFKISNEYGIYEIKTPEQFIGKSLVELNLRQNYSLNLITIKTETAAKKLLTLGQKEKYVIQGVPTPDTKIQKNDILVLFGVEKKVKELLEL